MKLRKRIVAALLVAALASAVGVAYARGSLYWDRYDVDIVVNTDGTFRVTETQTIVFVDGSFHVGFAAIPIDKLDTITDVQVWEDGRPYQRVNREIEGGFQTFVEGNEFLVEWYFPYTSDAQRNFTLAYTVEGGLRYYPDADPAHDVLQWIAVAPDHDFPIHRSRVTVHLPRGANVLRDPSLPTGFNADAIGGDAVTRVDVERGLVTVDATRTIQPGEALEVGVKFEHGVVAGQPPPWQAGYDAVEQQGPLVAFLSLFATIGILVLGPLGLFLLWYVKGRDPEVGLAAEYLAEPPSNAPPGLVGVLVDERADMKDIIATLIDLARRGALTMEEVQKEGLFGIGFSRDYVFRANSDFDQKSLRDYERTLLTRVVGQGEQKLSMLKNKFYTSIPTIEKQMYAEVVKERFFPASPKGIRVRYAAIGVALMVIAFVGAVVFIPQWGDISIGIIFPFGALGFVGLLTMGASSVMPAKTRKGAEEAAKWRAFQTFLKDLPRFQKVEEATDLFDKYLPYAIAFGLERRWISMFSRVEATRPPIWYRPWYGPRHVYGSGRGAVGTGGGMPAGQSLGDGLAGSLQSMNQGLTSLFNQAGQVFRSAPSSSGSGRGFGGGFSGGGFRGGGGGGGGSRGFR